MYIADSIKTKKQLMASKREKFDAAERALKEESAARAAGTYVKSGGKKSKKNKSKNGSNDNSDESTPSAQQSVNSTHDAVIASTRSSKKNFVDHFTAPSILTTHQKLFFYLVAASAMALPTYIFHEVLNVLFVHNFLVYVTVPIIGMYLLEMAYELIFASKYRKFSVTYSKKLTERGKTANLTQKQRDGIEMEKILIIFRKASAMSFVLVNAEFLVVFFCLSFYVFNNVDYRLNYSMTTLCAGGLVAFLATGEGKTKSGKLINYNAN